MYAPSKRPESQDFVEGGDYSGLFDNEQIRPGPVEDLTGRQLGTHTGIVNYTIGQRRGIGIAHHEPLHVLRIDAENNTIVVGARDDLFRDTLVAGSLNFLSTERPPAPVRIQAKIRHNQPAADAELTPLADGRARVVFDRPQWAITPGQSVVFYDRDVVLGGGIIHSPTDLKCESPTG